MNEEIYDNIKDLIQLDVDAVQAYEQALKKIDKSDIYDRIESFKDDHQRHIDDLSTYLIDNGREVPKLSPDLKGLLIEGFTSIRSITGTDGALKAMESNEKLTNKKYKEATDWAVDPDLRIIIMQNYEDERMHLAYIEEQLSVHAY